MNDSYLVHRFPKVEPPSFVLSMSTRMSNQPNLLDLPVEILSEILSHLDHLYILRSSAVSIPSSEFLLAQKNS